MHQNVQRQREKQTEISTERGQATQEEEYLWYLQKWIDVDRQRQTHVFQVHLGPKLVDVARLRPRLIVLNEFVLQKLAFAVLSKL